MEPEQRDEFLDALREGYDRQSASVIAGLTGTQTKRLLTPSSRTYDENLHAEVTEILDARPEGFVPIKLHGQNGKPTGVRPEPRTKTELGFTRAKYLTEEDKEAFLEKIREGIPRDLAARECGTSLSQVMLVVNREPAFRKALDEAYEFGYPNYQEWLRGKIHEQIREGHYPAVRDAAIVHLPEYAQLKTSRHEIGGLDGGSLKIFVEQVLPTLSPHVLEQVIRDVELNGDEAALKALPPPAA